MYTLGLSTDDGSKMYLGEDLIIDNDGLHGDVRVEATEVLEKGYHPIRIEMFQKKGGKALSATIKNPGGEDQVLSNMNLFSK